jgi:hypothetical protein
MTASLSAIKKALTNGAQKIRLRTKYPFISRNLLDCLRKKHEKILKFVSNRHERFYYTVAFAKIDLLHHPTCRIIIPNNSTIISTFKYKSLSVHFLHSFYLVNKFCTRSQIWFVRNIGKLGKF